MKKYLVASTAIISALIAMPAHAELNLDLGGHFRGYGVYSNNDAPNLQEFDLRRDTEVHFTGEATSDNGLTVGVHYEAMVGGTLLTDEAYAYAAGNWGRVNFGSEDGAAYLLQVAAPSADSNVDGLRTGIQAIGSPVIGANIFGAGGSFDLVNAITNGTAPNGYTGVLSPAFGTDINTVTGNLTLDYDHADFQDTDRITYLTPKFSGFQAGVSYAPQAGQKVIGNGLAQPAADNQAGQFDDLWEVAARWDGEFEGFGLSAGAGYSTASLQAVTPVGNTGFTDDLDTWNVGLNVAFQGFSVGGSYLDSSTKVDDGATAGGVDLDTATWVIGAAWDNGPYHVGASYLDQTIETQGAADLDADRWTIGAGYTYGPGMSFRGALANGNVDDNAGTDDDFTQVTIGTDIQF